MTKFINKALFYKDMAEKILLALVVLIFVLFAGIKIIEYNAPEESAYKTYEVDLRKGIPITVYEAGKNRFDLQKENCENFLEWQEQREKEDEYKVTREVAEKEDTEWKDEKEELKDEFS